MPVIKRADLQTEQSHLPLIELPVDSVLPFIAVLFTGDGGWASLDRQIGAHLQERGIPVVGFNSLKYFWQKRSVAETAKDLEIVILHYTRIWKKNRVILIGYSFGADVLPFITSRLPLELLNKVALITLMGPSEFAEFEFHVSGWVGRDASKHEFPVQPELMKLADKKILCIWGDREKASLCPQLTYPFVKTIILNGDHHLGGDYARISDIIIEQIQSW
ncbi:MAG: AcvB/VirJ family lysyl-phosphatidylglycerol hydrolase [bacterium]